MQTELVVTKLIAAIENRDAKAVGILLDDKVIFENVPEGKTINGRANAEAQFKLFFDNTSKIQWDIEQRIISGSLAVIERKNNITFQGKDITLPMVTIMEVQNGKILSFKDYFDSETFAKQMK